MGATLDIAEHELWSRLREGGDTGVRERLFMHHVAWARSIALNVHRRLWSYSVERSDCVQNATVGLLEAIDRYDPSRGIGFRAYATPRVRGAVFNGLRALVGDQKGVPAADRFLERLGDFARPDQMDPVDNFVETVLGLGLGFLIESAHEALVDERDGYRHAETGQLNSRVLCAVQGLTGRHRQLIELHYFHHLRFGDVAAQWGVSKGRVSQLHKEALTKLQALIHGDTVS